MIEWAKTLTVCICILTILMQLIPQTKYIKYVRFYGGLILLFVAAGPLLNLFTGEGELERLLQLEFLKEEYTEMELAAESLSELKNEQIQASFQKEIQRQIQDLALAYGLENPKIEIHFQEDGYSVNSLTIWANNREDNFYTEEICAEIAAVYGVDTDKIRIVFDELEA